MDAENRSDQQKNFDQWLDSALRTRVDAEPRTGLEERVLARLASQPERTPVNLLPLFAFAAAVLAVVIGIALLRPDQAQHAIAHAQPASGSGVNNASAQASSRPKIAGIHKPRNSRFIRSKNAVCCELTRVVSDRKATEHLPKLASFPAPHPETEQEKLLAQLAAQMTVQKQVSEIATVSIDSPPKDLSVKELSIEPLETTPAANSPQQ
jgi:hypothetical protein